MTKKKRFRTGKGIYDGDYFSETIIDEKTSKKYYGGMKPNYISSKEICDLLNNLHEENKELKEEKELLKNKLDRIEDILPHYLSCAEISEFRGKTFKEDIALMKCWNKRYQK